MKIKIKASVVLNPHETGVVAGVLRRSQKGSGQQAATEAMHLEEKRVIEEFMLKHEELGRFLDR